MQPERVSYFNFRPRESSLVLQGDVGCIGKMNRICVATSRSRAYYSLVSRLRKAGLPFVSLVPGSSHLGCEVVLTTVEEAGQFGPLAMPIEELDENPSVLKGQVLSRLAGGEETLLIGVDPGTRIGMAVYYGEANLEFISFDSAEALCAGVASFVDRVPAKQSVVRVGNGNPALAMRLATSLADWVPKAAVEVVDESGTSSRAVRMRGVQGDQRAAAKIAFRKGDPFVRWSSRTPG